MEVTGFGGVTEYTIGHVQLVLRVGLIVALTQFHVVNAEAPYHVLLGRPWLHKHKLVSSTYHQCVKGRLNGKPIRIAANSSPFNQTEAHFVEATLYDDLTSTEDPPIVKPCGIPLPNWEDIKDDTEVDLRECVRPDCPLQEGPTPEEGGLQPSCHLTQQTGNSKGVMVDQAESMAVKAERSTTAEPKMITKEELEVINLSDDPAVNVFAWDYDEMPVIDPGLVAHSLNVEPGTRPVVQPMRTFHMEVEAQITQDVKKLFATRFIKPIQNSRWLSNIMPVKKKNGQIRCCVDFHNLNKACPKDEFPLPNMDFLIDLAAGHATFSFIDGFNGYNQIRMSTKDAEKIVFHTPIGNFYYTVMPFGLKNADATYQRTMTAMFHDMMHKEIEDYVDDIVVKSKKREDHLETLRKVFDRCRLYKLKMNPLKCAFGVSAGKFLGFLVHNHGIDVDPAKASAIVTMKAPTSHKELKSFLGRLSYIRRFIPGLVAVWSTACQQAFEKIQAIMTKLPIIITETPTAIKSQAIADLLAQFPGEDSSSISHEVPGGTGEALLADLVDSMWMLKFDGSSTSNSSGAGIVLIRENGETMDKSFKLDFSCFNNASEYEAYAKGEFSLKEPSLAPYHALAQKLEEKFDTFEISHAMRCGNRYADALATLGSQISFERPKVDVTINKRSTPITDLLKEEFEQQHLDAEDSRTPIKAKLMSPEGVADLKTLKDYVLIAGDLYRRLPGGVLERCLSLREAVNKLIEVHERSCEFSDGVSLYRRLQRLGYFWPNMNKEAASLQEQCSFCQHQHESDQVYATFTSSDWRTPFLEYLIENILPQTNEAATRLKKLATRYFVEGDLIGLINPSSYGYIWILVATEYFSKWIEAISLRKATGVAVANFIREHIITRFGIPHKIISDNGTPFVNNSVREVLEHYRIKHHRSTPYYPQDNGQAEATNRMLLRILSKIVFDYGKGWNSHLADALWAYRGSTKMATGFTSFSLVYGIDAIAPTELLVPSPRILHGMDLETNADICTEAKVADLESLEEARELAQARSLRTVDHVRRGLPSPSKFAPNWEGPYLIREAYDSGYYKLATADGTTQKGLVGTISREPKRASNGATQEKPKIKQPTMGPENIGSFQRKAICCEAQKSLGHLPQAKHNKSTRNPRKSSDIKRQRIVSSLTSLEVTVHHPLRTADSYLTTAVADSATRQTRNGLVLMSGRYKISSFLFHRRPGLSRCKHGRIRLKGSAPSAIRQAYEPGLEFWAQQPINTSSTHLRLITRRHLAPGDF
uniref:Integrase catalytic domain-containing protein n=1 Tax=Fagus sylvatica TaxID=28930 RepID=A0A2N9GBC8_FAGSY